MLGTIRLYALDRLAASGEEPAVREAHLGWAAAMADDLERRLERGQQWRTAFDMVADDLRAALITATSPNGHDVSHRLARTLGHLAYARRFLLESRGPLRGGRRARAPGQAAWDLRAAADVAMAEGEGGVAFDLLLASAQRAAEAGDNAAQASALAYAATIADRFAGNFPQETPHDRLRHLVAEAARLAPAGDPVTAAYLASAAAWTTQPEKSVPDPALVDDALAAARRTGDPVLISGALDAVVEALDASGRLREAHQVNQERAALLEPPVPARPAHRRRDRGHLPHGDRDRGDRRRPARTPSAPRGWPRTTTSPPGSRTWPPASRSCRWSCRAGSMRRSPRRPSCGTPGSGQAGHRPGGWARPRTRRCSRTGCAAMTRNTTTGWSGSGRSPGPARTGTDHLASFAAFSDARIALHQGRIDAAVVAVAGLPLGQEPWYGTPHWYSARPYAWAIAAEVAIVAGLPDAADRLAAAAPAGEENYWAAACLARAAGRLNGDHGALARSLAGWEGIDARFERACTLVLMDGRADEGRAELATLGCQPPA